MAACLSGSISSMNDILIRMLLILSRERSKTKNGRPSSGRPLLFESRNCGFRSGLGGLGLQRVLGDFHQLAKGGVVRGGDVREDLPVQGDFRGLQPFHEPAVGGAGAAGRGVDAYLPELAEGALLHLPVAKGILLGMIGRVGGVTVKFGAAAAKALGGFDRADAAFAGGGGVGNSHRKSGKVECSA